MLRTLTANRKFQTDQGPIEKVSPSLIFDETHISQVGVADDTLETVGVPALTHSTNHTANNEFP